MIRRPPRSTLDRSSAASDVYKRQDMGKENFVTMGRIYQTVIDRERRFEYNGEDVEALSLIHISEPTRPY